MPKISKAARGKHRWIGLIFDDTFLNIDSVRESIQKNLNKSEIKLYDYFNEKNRKSCIIKVKLEEYNDVRDLFVSKEGRIFSITSSGKIRLVRLRLDEYFQRQIDG